eukprot:8824354-Heterocapsa_arctica.AAC.1
MILTLFLSPLSCCIILIFLLCFCSPSSAPPVCQLSVLEAVRSISSSLYRVCKAMELLRCLFGCESILDNEFACNFQPTNFPGTWRALDEHLTSA